MAVTLTQDPELDRQIEDDLAEQAQWRVSRGAPASALELEHWNTIGACPCCGHKDYPVGVLGDLHHYQCRDCGWWYSA